MVCDKCQLDGSYYLPEKNLLVIILLFSQSYGSIMNFGCVDFITLNQVMEHHFTSRCGQGNLS